MTPLIDDGSAELEGCRPGLLWWIVVWLRNGLPLTVLPEEEKTLPQSVMYQAKGKHGEGVCERKRGRLTLSLGSCCLAHLISVTFHSVPDGS